MNLRALGPFIPESELRTCMAHPHLPVTLSEPDGFNMTPLVDVTFLLLVFFMLVTELNRVQEESVRLPEASRAVKDDDASVLLLTIGPDGQVRIGGRSRSDAELEALFEARRWRPKVGSEYPLLIRADRSTPFEHVQKIVMMARDRGQVTRVHFGAIKD